MQFHLTIPYITLTCPLYSLINPLYDPKGPFKGLSFSPLIHVVALQPSDANPEPLNPKP